MDHAVFHEAGSQRAKREVPVVMQMTSSECGAACLAMILNYFHCDVGLAEIRKLLPIGRDGVTAARLKKAASQLGLRVKAFTVQDLSCLAELGLPAVIHWRFNHFVVLESWSPRRVVLADPARGRREVDGETFARDFTGPVLTFEPGHDFPRLSGFDRPKQRHPFAAAWRIPGLFSILAQVVAASLALQVLCLAPPLFTQILVDQILPFQLQNLMIVVGAAMVLIALTQSVLTYLRQGLLIYLQARLDSGLMKGFFEHMLNLPFSFFETRTTGDLLMRLAGNTMIRETLTTQLLSALLDGGLVLGSLLLLYWVSPPLALIALLLGLLQVGLVLASRHRVHHLMQEHLHAQAEEQGYLVETLKGIAMVKASGGETGVFDHWSNLFTRQLNLSLQRQQLLLFVGAGLSLLRTLSPLALLWMGVTLVLSETLSLGTMLAATGISAVFLAPLQSLVSNAQQLQLVGSYLERIRDVLEAEPEAKLPADGTPVVREGRIEVRDLHFRYNEATPWVLRDIHFTVEPGAKVALVGRTGSGKSTLLHVLLGLYQAQQGSVFFDGRDLNEVDVQQLRGQVGVVLQDPHLFRGTIRQNIAFHQDACDEKAVVAAARLAAVHDDIQALPMGYETLLSDGGAGLSGGQRQRIALARALARDPRILFLDEATSHLDVTTEQQLERCLEHLTCTRVVVAHRLSTIRDADLILVLDRGRIVERGSHRQLIAQQGLYCDLVQTQLSG